MTSRMNPMGLFHRASRAVPASADGDGGIRLALGHVGYVFPDGSVGLHDVTCAFAATSTAVIGLNGSGKSTLLGVLDGSLTPLTGSVRVEVGDASLDFSRRRDRRRLSRLVVGVDAERLPPRLRRLRTVAQVVRGALDAAGWPRGEREARCADLLALCRLNMMADRPVDALGGLQRHLLSIAVALAPSPRMLVADEPTRGLEGSDARQVREVLLGSGPRVVFATHDLDIVSASDPEVEEALLLDEGRAVAQGPVRQVLDAYDVLIRERRKAVRRS